MFPPLRHAQFPYCVRRRVSGHRHPVSAWSLRQVLGTYMNPASPLSLGPLDSRRTARQSRPSPRRKRSTDLRGPPFVSPLLLLLLASRQKKRSPCSPSPEARHHSSPSFRPGVVRVRSPPPKRLPIGGLMTSVLGGKADCDVGHIKDFKT